MRRSGCVSHRGSLSSMRLRNLHCIPYTFCLTIEFSVYRRGVLTLTRFEMITLCSGVNDACELLAPLAKEDWSPLAGDLNSSDNEAGAPTTRPRHSLHGPALSPKGWGEAKPGIGKASSRGKFFFLFKRHHRWSNFSWSGAANPAMLCQPRST